MHSVYNNQRTSMDSLQKTTDAIKKQFDVARYKAGRLVHTETTYFNAVASKETYKEIGVDAVEIIETLDSHTCEICAPMDGKIIPMTQYEPGVTVPPFHPNCRGTTAPAIDPEILGERVAREVDGEVYYVPADMSYSEWRKAFVEGGEKDGFVLAFTPMSKYMNQNGAFDLEAAKADYKNFLQTVPEKNRMYLEQALEGVSFEQVELESLAFGYLPSDKTFHGKLYSGDTVYYNPSHPDFPTYDLRAVMTHELGHRIDGFFVQSWNSERFTKAITGAKMVLNPNPERFVEFCKSDEDGFLSDIMDAICDSEIEFRYFHGKGYWGKSGNKEREIFANLFSMESMLKAEQIGFIKTEFPDLWEAYKSLE